MMDEREIPLSDSLVKAASWTHNTSVNKLGYSPLQLMTGKAVSLPDLTTGNVATESMTDSEVVQRTMENLTKITAEFREANMRRKLKECQGIRVQSYQHLDEYIEGNLVWYQPLNGNYWLGHAVVLCHRGQSFSAHSAGDIRKVASCKVKPFQLIDRESNKDPSKEVMLEDGLEDVEYLVNQEEIKNIEDLKDDSVGAKYLKLVNTVSFSELCNYTVELHISKHGTPEAKAAKMNEIRKLKDYDTFEEGQETIEGL